MVVSPSMEGRDNGLSEPVTRKSKSKLPVFTQSHRVIYHVLKVNISRKEVNIE